MLSACEAQGDKQRYEEIVKTYTLLPDHLQSLVFAMAQEAAGDGQTPFEKATNIVNWLETNYTYALEVADQPTDVDFVSCFLLQTKEGYCTYFASAMAVLCRMVGVPARYVEGYVANPGKDGIAYVTGLQAHAWVEVYFDGYGWLTFDPTPAEGSGGEEDGPQSAENDP